MTEKETALAWLDEATPRLSDFHQTIYGFHEPAWREYRSARAYVELLRAEGFDVEAGSGGMPTAFRARWGDGGPVLGAYAEYDAVPGNSQEPVPFRKPREGVHPWAAGHTDPHSALGVGALAGVLATKHAMERHRLPGTLTFFGEPAEKVCGSKPVHAAKGYYDDLDAAFSYHPWDTNTAVLDIHCGSYWSVVFTFQCAEEKPWVDLGILGGEALAHGVPRSPGALDALCLMHATTKTTKENIYPHTALWTLNEAILGAGMATADNLPPRIAQIQYSWRSPSLDVQAHVANVLFNNARHAAGATNCTVHARWVTKTRLGVKNHALARATFANLSPTTLGEEAREFAREIQRNAGVAVMDDPFTADCQTLTSPEDAEVPLRRTLPPWQEHMIADDYVDYTWHAPTVRFYTGRPLLRDPGGWDRWPALALNGVRAAIDPTWISAGRTLAGTAIDLLTRPELLAAARAEHAERTADWVGPLLPADFQPPVDLPWPEYVDTPRGREWTLPTPVTFGERL